MSYFGFIALLLFLILLTKVSARPVPIVQDTESSPEILNTNSGEANYRSFTKDIEEGFSTLVKWLLIALAIIALAICACLRFLRDFCDKHADKIPVDKILDLYKKPQKEDN